MEKLLLYIIPAIVFYVAMQFVSNTFSQAKQGIDNALNPAAQAKAGK